MLALIILAFWPDVLVGWNSFFYRDFGVWAYPNAYFHRTRFWEGEMPLWNPLSNCGIPFLAQWNTLTLYPFSFLYLLLPLPWSLNIFCLAHLWLAGIGMYLLALSWTRNRLAASVAGGAYALNGLALHSLMWPHIIAALAWMPLVVFGVDGTIRGSKQRIILPAITAAVQMLTGAVEIVLMTWGILGALLFSRLISSTGQRIPVILRFGAVAVITAGVSAVQWLPFLGLLGVSQRSATFADSTWSMPLWGLANYLVPLFHQTKSVTGVYSQDAQQWTTSYYLGIGTVVLGAVAPFICRKRHVFLLAGLSVSGLLLALGDNGPVYPLLKQVFPLLGLARYPVKFVVWPTFAVPLLAAFAVVGLARRAPSPSGRLPASVGLLATLIIAGILWIDWTHPFENEDWRVTFQSGLSRVCFLNLILGLLVLVMSNRSVRSREWAGIALVSAFSFDGLTHVPRQNPTIPSLALVAPLAGSRQMPGLGQGRAMISPKLQAYLDHAATPDLLQYYLTHRLAIFGNCNLLDEIPKVNGFFPLTLLHESQVRSIFYASTNRFAHGLADFLSVNRISSDQVSVEWMERPSALPVLTAGQMPVFADAPAVLAALAEPSFSAREVVYLPSYVAGKVNAIRQSFPRVEINRVAAHSIEAMVTSAEPSIVVLSQACHPSWKAFVNDARTMILRANHAFQAVEIPAGENRVRFVFDDRHFAFGAAVSVLAFLVCLVGFCRSQTAIRSAAIRPA